MNDSFRDTIVPKSDQLNYDDVMLKPITVTITSVSRGDTQQPVSIAIKGYQPYKPCKSMRRVLIRGWGDIGADWVGKQLTLYGDENVKWAGEAVGGIRISHMSHIEDFQLQLTQSRGKRVMQWFYHIPTRVEKCVERLKAKKIKVSEVEKLIGKKLKDANDADFVEIGKIVKSKK